MPPSAQSRNKRSYQKISPVVQAFSKICSYGMLGRVLGAVYGRGLVQKIFCKQHAGALQVLLASADRDTDPRKALTLVMLGMRLDQARLSAIAHATGAQMKSWFPASGFEKILNLQAQGRRIIILNSHFGAARIVPLWLARHNLQVHSLEGKNSAGEFGIALPAQLMLSELSGAFLGRVTLEARKALEMGKILHLTGDGGRGARNITLPFLGRERPFAAGFAELALTTDAVVIPVFAPHNIRGGVNLEFLEPLSSGSPDESRSQRVDHLINNYATLLENRWKTDPGNVRHGQIDQFAQLPRLKVASALSFDDAVAL